MAIVPFYAQISSKPAANRLNLDALCKWLHNFVTLMDIVPSN